MAVTAQVYGRAAELLCYADFGTDVSSTGGPFTIAWHSNGIVTAAV